MTTSSGNDVVLVDMADRIATITLNRPEARNALSSEVSRNLRIAMKVCDANADVDVVILTGSDPAFSAGLDLKELGSTGGNLGTRTEADAQSPTEVRVIEPWDAMTKPVIGAINGVAITGGFELALQCDFRIASERARFGDTHTRVGVLPGWGLSVWLPLYIGWARAVEMSLTGNFMEADEALRRGLVNHVVPHAELLPYCRKLATDIVNNDQAGVRELLGSYKAIRGVDVNRGLVHEAAVGRDWSKRTFSPEAVEARRQAIMSRGRSML